MKQLTKEQATSFYLSKEWQSWNDEQIVRLQLFQDLLCVPIEVFNKAMNKVLNRPVYTHEFSSANYTNLIEEYLGTREAPTLDEIINLIPEEKRSTINL